MAKAAPDPLARSIANAFATSATLREAIAKLLEAIGSEGRFVAGQYWQRDPARDQLSFVANWRAPAVAIPEFEAASRARTFRPGEGLPGRVLESGAAAAIPDLAADDNFPRAPFAAGLGSAAAVPLIDHDVVGVFEFFRAEKGL